MTRVSTLLYLGGIDLPMRQARAIQTLHTAHALAREGCKVLLPVGRGRRAGQAAVLAEFGLQPHADLQVQPLPTLRLPRLPLKSYIHPRLAAWNWSYGLAALLWTCLLPDSRRPDAVLARDPRLARIFMSARGLTGAEVYYEVHELFSTRAREPVAVEQSGPPTRTPRVRLLEESVFAGAAGLISLTHCCKQLLVEDFCISPDHIIVAPDAVARVPKSLPLRSPQSRTVIYAGQLYPWKGVGTLVEAIAALPDARLKIVGGLGRNDAYAAALRRLAAGQSLLNRVEFMGHVAHADVPSVLSDSAIGVVPLPDNPMSRYFTSPLKVYEYMAAGLPIVASDLPALREVLEDQRNALLVPPDDPAALASAIRRLFLDPQLAERLRTWAHAAAIGRTWAARARTLLAFLDSGSDRSMRTRRVNPKPESYSL